MDAIEIYTNPTYGTRICYARTPQDTWPGDWAPLGSVGIWYGNDQVCIWYGDSLRALHQALNNTLYNGHLMLSCEKLEMLGWTLSDADGEVYLSPDQFFELTHPREGRGYVGNIREPNYGGPVYLEVS